MEQGVIDIIKQILKEAKEEGIQTIGKTKLVKLMYLLEVEYYKLHQKRLTNLKWKFFHFGPYPLELQEILGSPELEEEIIDLTDGKVFFKYSIYFDEPGKSYTEPRVRSLIARIVKKWGGMDLNRLLDYVYFETEPMMSAKRGELLDFSKIPKWREIRIKKIHIDRKKLSEIRERIRNHIAKLPAPKEPTKFNMELSECLRIWDEGKLEVPIRGTCTIDISEFENK